MMSQNFESIDLRDAPLNTKSYTYNNHNFPCFVKHGATVEDIYATRWERERYRRIARNALRHLTYGTSLYECQLVSWLTFKALFIKRDPQLFDALREEMRNLFYIAFTYLQKEEIDTEAEKRLEIFIKNILAAYPYMDPKQGEVVYLPQKINGKWEFVRFRFDKIDISPQSGLLSKLIDESDRLYAYGLIPDDNKFHPFLLLMGSHYPSGQGADINWLYNFMPGKSVGEGHDLTNIEKWLRLHPNARITGHSKGGTLAMILAAIYPQWVKEANCLNPAPLSDRTVNALNQIINSRRTSSNPAVNIYVQVNDPVFLLGNQFLTGASIFSVGNKNEKYSFLEAHAHYFSGRKSTLIETLTAADLKATSKQREFISDLKEALNWAVFPTLYARLVYKLSAKKIEQFLSTSEVSVLFSPVKMLSDTAAYCTFLSVLTTTSIAALTIGATISAIKLATKTLIENELCINNNQNEELAEKKDFFGTTQALASVIHIKHSYQITSISVPSSKQLLIRKSTFSEPKITRTMRL